MESETIWPCFSDSRLKLKLCIFLSTSDLLYEEKMSDLDDPPPPATSQNISVENSHSVKSSIES